MKKSKLLIHIPHSSLKIPHFFWKNTVISKKDILNENLFITDLHVNKLVSYKYNKIVFPYSRLFCDVERFKDDRKETMSKKGMGVLYTSTSYGINFINYDSAYKNMILSKYYDKHHEKLSSLCKKIIDSQGKCLIIDLHSFSDTMCRMLFNKDNFPDLCIGVDEKYTSKKIMKFTKSFFEDHGYSVKINDPYSGTIFPLDLEGNNNLSSIMLEINKRIYLNSIKRNKFKKVLNDYLYLIEKL